MASKDNKPKVGFATHIIAGGIAGMAEAVRTACSLSYVATLISPLAGMPTS
jgi:hypothetical protein